MKRDAFEAAYEALNPEQRHAVDTIEGPVMVIAGPGTGKTQILTLRIANILKKTDTRPENILALTFTDAGSRAMRERLHGYVGSAAHRVAIHTFHEFAGELIRTYPEAYARAVGGRLATDLEKVTILEDIIESSGVKALRPHNSPAYYIRPLTETLALLKREYITADALTRIIAAQETLLQATPRLHEKGAHRGKVRSEYQKLEKDLERNRELHTVYCLYDAALEERKLFDFEDMIFETVVALEANEDMLRDLQERYQYILADEHQDVNGSQNRILELLASFHECPNLFVVGDEKQAIYRFQGASLENFLYFEERNRDTVSIALTKNYRSSQNILDLAHALITAVPSPAAALRVPLRAQTKESGVIEKRVFAHEAVEDDALVARVESLVLGGTPRSEIAVIVRTNREVDTLAARIRARGITVMASADTDILAHPITKTIEGLMSVVTEPENEEALFRVLHEPFWHIAPGDLVKLFRARSFDTPLASLIARDDMLEALALEDPASISRVHAVITGARANATIDAPHRVLEYLVRESGLLAHLMATDPLEGMRVVRRLYDEVETLLLIKQTTTMRDVNALFRMRVEHTLPLTAPYIYVDPDAVRVMTAHKSKGLEFSHVFIPHLTENHWGDPRRKTFFKIPLTKELRDEGFDEIDDERKLLYVALTRAKRGLYLSSAEENSEGKPLSPTLLLEDIGEGLITHLSTEAESRAFDAAGVMRERVTRAPIDAALLRSSLTERGLSATSLNNYLKSPWDYFYRNVLRIPETKDESLLFGTALHDVLCRALRYRAEHEELPSASRVKEYLERELGKLPLTVAEYTRLHARGLEALTLYLAHCGADLPPVTREEVKFEARLPTGLVEFPEVLLTGKLDRLDFDAPPEEGGKLIRVIDYKTGKPKTKGQIEGTTKDSNGGYKRQLVFYALLLSLQDDARYQSRDGLLAFIEPDGKGKIREERYTISDDEIEALRADIIRIVGEIANGAFLSSPCDPETSKYCDLVELLRRERA